MSSQDTDAVQHQEITLPNPDSPEAHELSAAQQRALECWQSVHQFYRRTVEEAWKCGQALAEVKQLMPHGEWEAWLKSKDISRSRAHRWIKLSKGYDEVSQVGTFGSVDAALKALPPARPRTKDPVAQPVGPEQVESPTPVFGDERDQETMDRLPDAPEAERKQEGEPSDSGHLQDHGQHFDDDPEVPDDLGEAQQEIRQLRHTLRDREDQLRKAQEEIDRLTHLLAETTPHQANHLHHL